MTRQACPNIFFVPTCDSRGSVGLALERLNRSSIITLVHKENLASMKGKEAVKSDQASPGRLHTNSPSHSSEPTPEATTNKEAGSYFSLINFNAS